MPSRTHELHALPRRTARQRLWPAFAALAATLLGAPVNAATTDFLIPAVPLQSGTPYPAPNVMFILDDSGSMTYSAMPANVSSFSDLDNDIWDKSYVHNTIYYDPRTTYKTWIKWDGTRYTGGTDYTAAYSSNNLASGWTTDLSDRTQTWFVPKADATDLDDPTQYDQYSIKKVSGTLHVVKSGATVRKSWNDEDIGEHEWFYDSITVPAGAGSLTVTIDGQGNGDADLYLRLGSKPTTASGTYDHRSVSDDNDESITVSNPTAGTWWIGVYNADSGSGNRSVKNEDIVATVDTSSYSTGTTRSEAEEMTNFATWYSYHRTRMKVAKYGASEAFSQLDDNYRVGYDSIWNRHGSDSVYGNDPAFPIPTGTNDGLFTGDNREDWFEYLQSAVGNNGTPLHGALQRAGEYYKSSDPWESGDGGDPISCRLSFSILTTDGFWNDDSGYDDVGDQDTTAGSTIQRPAGSEGLDFTYSPSNPFQDPDGTARRDTLADVAMYYWKRDLRSDLDNNVPSSDADEAWWQHMTTFSISIGLQGRLDPEGDLDDIKSGAKEWPNPLYTEDEDRIDDLWHAAVNGHGQFVAATNPAKFVSGLLDALSTVAERPGSASNVTANSTSFQTNTRVYQASYVSGRWSGDLKAYVATSAGVEDSAEWSASEKIPDVRNILTWDSDAGEGAAFPTPAQVTALDATTRGSSPVSGDDNADYIAGSNALETDNGGELRNRTTVLGDIANSSPIYVNDSDTLFVGANDGMLHAFDASTGVEKFAYVPGGIDLAGLATLSSPYYTHKYFVDGPVTVSAQSQTPGKNYLVGALGRGGRGVFGLDVTDPDNFDAGDVLWESSSDSDMGMVLGDPLVVKLNKEDPEGDPIDAVLVSNGINSPDGSATLFVLNLATGEKIAEIQAGSAGSNGLSAPRGWDNDGDGTVDYVYAGDVRGNVWKFDLSSTTSSDWAVSNSGNPMFVARDDAGNRQPITAGLALARHPETGQRWIFFGTGSFITSSDLTSDDVQTLYGIIDDQGDESGVSGADSVVDGRTSDSDDGDLVERDILLVGTSSSGRPIRGFEPSKSSMESGKLGWYIDLDQPTEGERVVSGPRVLGSVLITSSIEPPTGNTCDAGGSGYLNALDAFTGSSTSQPFFDINGDGVVNDSDKVEVTVGGVTTNVAAGSIDPGIGMLTRPTVIDERIVVGGSTGQISSLAINPQGIGAKRVSWREILED